MWVALIGLIGSLIAAIIGLYAKYKSSQSMAQVKALQLRHTQELQELKHEFAKDLEAYKHHLKQESEKAKQLLVIHDEEMRKSLNHLQQAIQVTQELKDAIYTILDAAEGSIDEGTILQVIEKAEKVKTTFQDIVGGSIDTAEEKTFHKVKNIARRMASALRNALDQDEGQSVVSETLRQTLRLWRIELTERQNVLRDSRTKLLYPHQENQLFLEDKVTPLLDAKIDSDDG